MRKINRLTFVAVLVMTVLLYERVGAEKGIPVKLAVIPFDVHSAVSEPKLGKDFAVMISHKLALNPYIYLSDIEEVQSVIKTGGINLEPEKLKENAKLLSANFILFGSVTKINDYHSIDVQLFNVFPPEEYSKAFVEGTDIELLVESLASRIEAEVLAKAEYIPLSQRLNIKAKDDLKVDEDFIFAMEDEIGEEKKGAKPEEKPAIESDDGKKENNTEKEQITESSIFELEEPGEKDVSEVEAEKSKKKTARKYFKTDRPVNINSDTMEYDNAENRILFDGNVVARQGDIVMFADKMDVLNNDQGDIQTIALEGNVKVIQDERIATGDNIIFHNQEQKIVVTGNPRVWQGDNVIHGKKITVFLKEDRSMVEGGPDGRVNATIYPGKTKP